MSSGTELLMWRGDFDQTDEALDASIAGLKDEGIKYPFPCAAAPPVPPQYTPQYPSTAQGDALPPTRLA